MSAPRGSYTSACQAFYLFFATSLINLIILEHECWILLSYDIKITLKSHFWRKKKHYNFVIMYALLSLSDVTSYDKMG